ncbi:MAG: aconitate hydratase AcnA [Proteobacteria bacterium]|nr:aconitate hydratase AcnA [Pseudomonadota bacterium]
MPASTKAPVASHPFTGTLESGGRRHTVACLNRIVEQMPRLAGLPYSLQIMAENIARHIDGRLICADDLLRLTAPLDSQPAVAGDRDISFTPARVVMQDFTGVPAVVDFAAMRDWLRSRGESTDIVNPLVQTDLVIDHSVSVDSYGSGESLVKNMTGEYQRNRERYQFLRWGQESLKNFRLVPPATGIVHQINLEYLAPVVMTAAVGDVQWAYPDTVVGTDSHTTMINGLGVLGWGVGGIEAEAAMLGQPIALLVPKVVGVRLHGHLPAGATATDLVLAVTEMLRNHGVVGKFVEFFGPGLDSLELADRATVANMAPEYGATCGLFPPDNETLNYLSLTGRSDEQTRLIEDYFKYQGMWRDDTRSVDWDEELALDLSAVRPCIAGPSRPQDRIDLDVAGATVARLISEQRDGAAPTAVSVPEAGYSLRDGSVVIAAITSCTNTSNPAVILGAGLFADKARARGLKVQPWVKTSLAPGSRVVSDYLVNAGLMESLEALGFYVVGYGCTTCIGNSGALDEAVSQAITEGGLHTCAVLSGNRNFEGRVHPMVRMNFLASPILVVAYAIAGRADIDFAREALGTDDKGVEVYLADLWPSADEIKKLMRAHVRRDTFAARYSSVFSGDSQWSGLQQRSSDVYAWDESSTYIRRPSFFERVSQGAIGETKFDNLRVLALLGDSITTDHISPAGAIAKDSAAARYLQEQNVQPQDFNSYGSRRGNHEVMVRGTFANIRLRNKLADGKEGGYTVKFPGREPMSIYDAAMQYQHEGTGLVVIAGREYGSGSSRDWAAKGTLLLGVRAVLAESYERIHRSNLVGMGVLPLQFNEGDSIKSLGLRGDEVYSIDAGASGSSTAQVLVSDNAGAEITRFSVCVRIDSAREWEYYCSGGILPYVLEQLVQAQQPTAA